MFTGEPLQIDPEPIIEAVTALDWSADHPILAARAIQEVVRTQLGANWSEERAVTELRRLLDLKLIAVKPDHPATNIADIGKPGPILKTKYFRTSQDER